MLLKFAKPQRAKVEISRALADRSDMVPRSRKATNSLTTMRLPSSPPTWPASPQGTPMRKAGTLNTQPSTTSRLKPGWRAFMRPFSR